MTTARNQQTKGIKPRRFIGVLLLFTLLTTVATVAMFAWGIPMGEPGQMVYRYSPFWILRLERCWPVILVIGILAWAGRLLTTSESRAVPGPESKPGETIPAQPAGLLLGFIGILILCAWTWYLPPHPADQQVFNLMSPSQDGAFVIEAQMVGPMDHYLRNFPLYLQRAPEDVLGTRVLSNPPGMTLLAAVVRWTIGNHLPAPWPERIFIASNVLPEHVLDAASRLRFSFVLTAMLALSSIFAYLLGREFLSPIGAGVLAVLITINPATASFSPGKDPAQLLTINAMLWAWFASARHWRFFLSSFAGALLVIGSVFGLIHIWIALVAVIVSFINSAHGGSAVGQEIEFASPRQNSLLRYPGGGPGWGDHRKTRPQPNPSPESRGRGLRVFSVATKQILARILGAILGAAIVCLIAQLTIGWNIPETLLAVANRFGQIQNTIHYTRWIWWIIGLPMFWLFLSPIVPALAFLPRHPFRNRSLLICTLCVMLLTFLIGVTYELPRLWIAFLPLLTLGVCVGLPILHGPPRRGALKFILIILSVHLLTTAIHASLLDARESEFRMMHGRLFN